MMKKIIVLFFLCITLLFCSEKDSTFFIIENGESGDASTYYDEKPPVLENTYDIASQGSRSIHFKTSAKPNNHDLITKYYWPKTQDFSMFADNGKVSFDLWLVNPGDIRSESMGAKLEFTLMSRNNEKRVSWYIGAGLFKPEVWNNVVLRIKNGRADLENSTVNGVPLNRDKESAVENTGIDWKNVNYHRFAIPHGSQPVEGYIDNVVISVFEETKLPYKEISLSLTDPNSHIGEVERNKVWPKYDIIPPDVKKESFFSDALINFDQVQDWKAFLYDCDGIFCMSNDQSIRGVSNIKIEVKRTGPNAKIVLYPPAPIKIKNDFDTIDCWIYTYTHGGILGISFRQKDGSIYRWSGGNSMYGAPGFLQYWTLARVVLPKKIESGAELVSIDITPPDGKNETIYLYHIDQLRLSLFTDFISQPAPEFKNIGTPVKIPVNENGACPVTNEKVNTKIEKYNNKYYLIYSGDIEGTVKYIYEPGTGTLDDLTVEVEGKKVFKPAKESGPVFQIGNKVSDATLGNISIELIDCQIKDNAVQVIWKYNLSKESEIIKYNLSLKGKTLQIDAESQEKFLSQWKFGYAEGLTNAKVVEVPFMNCSPNVLYSDDLFVTYYADWYQSNTSTISYIGDNKISGENVWYSYSDGGYRYLSRTDGSRHPFRERFYITVSKNFDDVLLSISNPPSPFKEILKKRLYRMVSPSDNFINITRQTIDLYDKYGITDIYFLFHCGLWSNRGGRGPEPFMGRMNVSCAYDDEGGNSAVISLFKYMSDKGIYPGYYDGYPALQPIDTRWQYNRLALLPDGNWKPTWVQCYFMKPWLFPELASTEFKERTKKFGVRVGYKMDTLLIFLLNIMIMTTVILKQGK